MSEIRVKALSICYMDNPEQLQDEIGAIIAESMTEYWRKNG